MSPEHVQMAEYIVVLVGAGMSIFIGNSSSIAATSFSREGKGLYDLKAMPIENRTIALVKVWHAFLYIGLAIIITIIALTALWLCLEVPVTPAEFGKMIFLVALLTVSVSLVLVFIDMFLDTANPKLTWETPIAAFKQNLNAVLAVFISLGVVGVFVVLAIFLPKTITGASIISVIFIETKQYPMDYDAAGKLIVDPDAMKPDTYSGIAMIMAWPLGLIVEKKHVGFTTEGSLKTRIIRFIVGALLFVVLFKGIKLILGGFDPRLINFVRFFVSVMFAACLYPWLVMKWRKRKNA